VNEAMKQLTGTTLTNMIDSVNPSAQEALKAAGPAGELGTMPKSQLASVADAALDEALGVAPSATPAPAVDDAKVVGRSDNPSQHILVHNMYNKDEEMEQNWQNDIREDFMEECGQHGKITNVVVMYKEVGGKIYASFDSVEGATNCAKSLAGRWFDKRQLRVEFVDSIPAASA
jgi:RNA-binding protein 23/39